MSLQGITNDVPLLAWLRSGLKNDLAPDASAYDAILGSWSTLEKAPFRLLAIVNRSDLAKFKVNAASPEDGFVRGAELRFEFGGINKATGKPVDFFIIVEFVLKNMSKAAFKIYLKKWLDLSSVGSLDRPSDLNNVLKDALATGVASARFRVLGQSKLNPARWPMREYGVTPSQVKLQALSRQLPSREACAQNETSPQLAWWVNQPVNVINALANQYEFSSPPHPDFCPGESTQPPRPSSIPTKSAAAVAQLPPFVFGTNVTVSPADVPLLQSRLALNSCTRCHQSATNTDFRHIFNRDRGKQSEVSGFLCGSSDCSTAASSGYFEVPSLGRFFNDLLRRHVFMLAALQLDPTGTNWTEKLDGLNTYEVH